MVDLTRLDIRGARNLLDTGAVSSVELTQGYLDRIAKVDASLHSYFAVTADHALVQARKADQDRAQGQSKGGLHGVPIAIKDLYETTFAPTTGALSHRRGFIAAADCKVVQCLEAEGAVILGKLATTEGAGMDHNPAWPTPLNPWGKSHWTGISSSGSGVAVAARVCLGALGSDTGGSIRFPSAACGITGVKPTYGRVSGAGVMGLGRGLDHFGPMTQSAADAALMLQAIAGRDAADPRTANAPDTGDYFGAIDGGVAGLRIGVDQAVQNHRTHPVVANLIGSALGELENAGVKLVPVSLPPMEDLMAAFSDVLAHQAAAVHADWFAQHRAGYGPALADMVTRGLELSQVRLENAQARCERWRADLSELMQTIDVLALPALANPVPLLASMVPGQPNGIGTFTIPFNISGSPTINFPVGFDADGMPVSLQLVGAHWSEGLLLRAAHSYQTRTDWHRKVPPSLD